MAELIEVGVWFEARPITVEQGVDRFEALRRGDTGWAAADPGIEKFHREVLAGVDAAWWAGPVVAADTHVLLSLQPETPEAALDLVHRVADECELLCFQRPGRHQPAALWQPRRLLRVPVPRLSTEDGSLAHHPTGDDIRDFLGRLDADNRSAVLWREDGSSIRVTYVPGQRSWKLETVVGEERGETVQDDLAGVAERFEAFAQS
ncbi:hypothetical protein GCM10009827_041620 [Dactylosporangium maewongense]|uniref:ESAT-6 protein secretion system EspG family protein n=1 Tax=Dactylosporangium maewongense TaxID=634393 RepID=A0ABN2AKX5_9ACTN